MQVTPAAPQVWAEPVQDPGALTAACTGLSPELLLLLTMLESNSVQKESTQLSLEDAFQQLEDLRQQIARAIEEAQEAQEDAGLWGDISSALGGDVATIAGVVASAALVLGTGGTGAAVVVAAVALGFTASGEIAEELELDPKIVMALKLAGAAAGFFAGDASQASAFWSALHTFATVTQGVAAAGGAGAHMVEGQYEGDAVEARALATFFRRNEQLTSQLTDERIAEIEKLVEQLRFLMTTTTDINAEKHDVDQSVIRRIGA